MPVTSYLTKSVVSTSTLDFIPVEHLNCNSLEPLEISFIYTLIEAEPEEIDDDV